MVSFGDSLSDSGNVFLATGCSTDTSLASGCQAGQVGIEQPDDTIWETNQYYTGGGFQDGPSWNQSMAIQLGIAPPTPSLANGNNYAYGGARVSTGFGQGNPPQAVPSLQEQVGQYLAANGNAADPDAIYTVFGGGNDIKGVAAQDWGPSEAFAAAGAITPLVQQLIAAGAKSILVANVPNVGLAPIASASAALATTLTQGYNATFATIGIDNPEVVLVDTYSTSVAIADDYDNNGSAAYGFTNISGSCAIDTETGVNTSGNCDSYLFYDLLHPTAAANNLIAADALAGAIQLRNNRAAVVPVPAAAWLFMSGLAGLVGLRKARK
jgi:outer membrane lipase/esterase